MIAYFAVGLNESYFNITASSCSEMHFLRKKFVNKWIKHETHLIDKKSSNHARSSSYKNFVPTIPFKKVFLIKKRYYKNECLDLAWDRVKVSQINPFITTHET